MITAVGNASIVSVTEVNLAPDTPAIIAGPFTEDVLAYSDRSHQHNGPAFDAGGTLSTAGANIVPLPNYLVGNDYVRFANSARDNVSYSATVTSDVPSQWYLLIDNRLNGPAGNVTSLNTTDPVLGGTLQWVIDGGWQRVNTGISPFGQADYTAVDEIGTGSDNGGNLGVGAGNSLDQFYSVYTLPNALLSVTVSNNGIGVSNMISLVAAPAPIPEPSALLVWSLFGLTLSGGYWWRRRR